MSTTTRTVPNATVMTTVKVEVKHDEIHVEGIINGQSIITVVVPGEPGREFRVTSSSVLDPTYDRARRQVELYAAVFNEAERYR